MGFSRGHLLDAVVFAPEPLATADAERLVEALLGEDFFDDWIGDVNVAPLPRGRALAVLGAGRQEAESYPIAELPHLAHSAIDALRAGLPARPYFAKEDADEWTMFELEPTLASDYAAQDDLVVATTLLPEMMKAYLQGLPIYSGRFSRTGELFCYLKLDYAGASAEEQLAGRRRLEDALDAVLAPRGDGCVIGNGIGLRYGYVDLALTRPEAVERVRDVALAAGAPARSWLLFLDQELDGEWLGVEPGTPPPPALALD
ncbi:MAG: hypothetical protein OZ921_06520 [Sorangiineae bacterium]|nr:hypothetical protein [Sorangiineae bacterium]